MGSRSAEHWRGYSGADMALTVEVGLRDEVLIDVDRYG